MTRWALILLLAALPAQAADWSGPAEAIDGDTLVIDGAVVRLDGIDAPPLDATCVRGDQNIPCGSIARGALLDLVTAMEVACTATGAVQDGLPAALCVAGGFEVNGNMVYTGWALPLAGITRYDSVAAGARNDRRGLWATDWVAGVTN